MVQIREFGPGDYQAIANIHNSIYPDRSITAQALSQVDEQRNPKCKARRWVALVDDHVVGFGGYSQAIFDYHPGRFHVVLRVLSDYRGHGVGSALYDQVMRGLEAFDPIWLRADGYGNLLEGVRFLERRGFKEVFRERPLHLDVMGFDPRPYAAVEENLSRQGLVIKTLRELESEPGRDRQVYELYWEATRDVPSERGVAQMDFKEWVEWTLKDPLVPHDGYFIAVDGEEYVGLSEFGNYPAGNDLQAGLVGVKQTYRGRGIALAMQLRGIAYARAKRHPLIKTSTAVNNKPMLSLYERLGFAAQPDWIQLEKLCREEPADVPE